MFDGLVGEFPGDDGDVFFGAPGSEGAGGGVADIGDEGHSGLFGEPMAERTLVGIVDARKWTVQGDDLFGSEFFDEVDEGLSFGL